MKNIIYLNTHDTGTYIEPYGYKIPTPNLMELAKESTLFRKAFSTAPMCGPSRSGLLTGMPPHENGMAGHPHLGFEFNDKNQHMINVFNRYGYETVSCGTHHVVETQNTEQLLNLGFEKVIEEIKEENINNYEIWDEDIGRAEALADYIRTRERDRPLFLSFGTFNTHRRGGRGIASYVFEDLSVDFDYVKVPHTVLDNKKNRVDMAGYITSAKIMDQSMGIVIDALQDKGYMEDSLIFFTVDHGISFPRCKGTLFDGGTNIALMIRYPENPTAGTAVDALVSQLDLYPTVCEYAGIEKPEWLRGISLMPLLENKTDKVHQEIFTENTFQVDYNPERAVRTEKYKLYRKFNKQDSNTYDDMLFNLENDTEERINLADDNRYRDVKNDLSSRLINWMKETGDKLLDGGIYKAPPTALVGWDQVLANNKNAKKNTDPDIHQKYLEGIKKLRNKYNNQ